MRVAFAGTPEFARAALAALVSAGFEVALVLSQPSRPAGRGQRPTASPVAAYAAAVGLAVATPAGLRLDGRHAGDAAAARQQLEQAAVDVMVVAAYGLILPAWLLALPRHGCINIHASLLPRWRGAAPIQRAIEAGDRATGVTLMQMDAGLDTGAMLAKQALPIDAADTAASLQARLAGLGAAMIVQALDALRRGPLPGEAQPAAGVTYATKIAKQEAVIDWHVPATLIERRLRAFDPFPGARSQLAGQMLTLWRGHVVADAEALPGGRANARPGQVAGAAGRLTVVCGQACLAIDELQRAGGRRLPAAEFLRGWQPPTGAVFDPPLAAPAG